MIRDYLLIENTLTDYTPRKGNIMFGLLSMFGHGFMGWVIGYYVVFLVLASYMSHDVVFLPLASVKECTCII